MIYRNLKIQVDYASLGIAHDGYEPRLTAYLPDRRGKNAGKAVLILPGGGYACTSDREGEPVALEYITRGIAAFVLWYSVAPNRYPTALLECGQAVRVIKANAKKWDVDPGSLYIVGFSAGGHLAGSYALLNGRPLIAEALGGSPRDFAVAGAILGYPVASSGKYAHVDSFRNLLGERYEQLKDELSLEKLVSEDSPRMFLWHTAADAGVPVQNSLLMALALAEHNVPFELHVYATRGHGLSLATDIVDYSPEESRLRHREWIADSVEWIEGK